MKQKKLLNPFLRFIRKYNLKRCRIRKEKICLRCLVWTPGSTHRSVVTQRGYKRPVDFYLEGSDQHRGYGSNHHY